MFQKKCSSCQLYIPQAKTCQIMVPAMKGKIEPDDYCSKHNDHILSCEICGAGLLEPFIYTDKNGKTHVACGEHINMIQT